MRNNYPHCRPHACMVGIAPWLIIGQRHPIERQKRKIASTLYFFPKVHTSLTLNTHFRNITASHSAVYEILPTKVIQLRPTRSLRARLFLHVSQHADHEPQQLLQ
jgi:hypothetical protein